MSEWMGYTAYVTTAEAFGGSGDSAMRPRARFADKAEAFEYAEARAREIKMWGGVGETIAVSVYSDARGDSVLDFSRSDDRETIVRTERH